MKREMSISFAPDLNRNEWNVHTTLIIYYKGQKSLLRGKAGEL